MSNIEYNRDFFEEIETLLDKFEDKINSIYSKFNFPKTDEEIIQYNLDYLKEYQQLPRNQQLAFNDTWRTWKEDIEEIPKFVGWVMRQEQKKYIDLLNQIEDEYDKLCCKAIKFCEIQDRKVNKLKTNVDKSLKSSFKRMFLFSNNKQESEIFNLTLRHTKITEMIKNKFMKESEFNNIFDKPELKRGESSNKFILNKEFEISKEQKKELSKSLDSYKFAKDLEILIKSQKIIFHNPKGINVESFQPTMIELKSKIKNSVDSMRKDLKLSLKENIDVLMTEVSINKLQAHMAKQINDLTWGTLDKLKKLKSSDKEELILSIICGCLLKDLGANLAMGIGKTADVAITAYKLLDKPQDTIVDLLSDHDFVSKFMDENKDKIREILSGYGKVNAVSQVKNLELDLDLI